MFMWLVKSKFCKTPKYYLDMFLTTKTIHPISSMNAAFSQQVNSNKITFPANISHRSQYHFYCSQFCSSEYMKEWQRRNKRHKFYARQRKWKTFRKRKTKNGKSFDGTQKTERGTNYVIVNRYDRDVIEEMRITSDSKKRRCTYKIILIGISMEHIDA